MTIKIVTPREQELEREVAELKEIVASRTRMLEKVSQQRDDYAAKGDDLEERLAAYEESWVDRQRRSPLR